MSEVNEIVEMKLMPAMSIDETVSAFKQYQSLRKKLAEKGDFISFGSGKGEKEAPTKQWRVKLSRYFGLCAEITKEWDTKEDDNSLTYHKRARVTHVKSGLFYEATGACNTGEKERDGAKKYHNAESHAETRAKNRVVFEFVGFGEVSAEEMTGSHDDNNSNNYTPKKNTPKTNNDLATQPQKDKIYGTVVCEKCGTRVYGFKCPICKNADNVNIATKGFIHSHLLVKEDFKKEMKPVLLPDELTKIDAMIIWDWWLGDQSKNITGERTKREAKEKEAEPTKEEKIAQARHIASGGKLELREGKKGLMEDDEEPGSSYNNAVPYKGKRKEVTTVEEDFISG